MFNEFRVLQPHGLVKVETRGVGGGGELALPFFSQS